MNSRSVAILVLLAAVVAGAGGYLLGRGPRGHEAEDEEAATTKESIVVSVKVAPLQRKTIVSKVSAYGTMSALAERLVVLSAQFDGIVDKVLVSPGQMVSKGDALAEVTPAPETILALKEAVQVAEAAEKDFTLVQKRYDMKLATAQELGQAQSTLRAANLKKENLEQRHAGERAIIRATQAGVVAKIDVQQGQAAASGAGIVEVLPTGQAVVRVGVEVSNAALLHEGQKAALTPLAASQAAAEGKVSMVGRRVNPESRLVDVLIALPKESVLPLETALRAEIEIQRKDALVVPRDAALPGEEGKYELFVVKDSKAVKHEVSLGLQSDNEVEVIGEDLKEGELVVVQGNYQLEDAMHVQVEGEAAQATTRGAM